MKIAMVISSLTIFTFSFAAYGLDACPPFSSPKPGYENRDNVLCTCNPGFQPSKDRCLPIILKRETIIRPMTPKECEQSRKEDVIQANAVCDYEFFGCLRHKGMGSPAAWCAVASAQAAFERGKAAVLNAAISCGQQFEGVYRACSSVWQSCKLEATVSQQNLPSCQPR